MSNIIQDAIRASKKGAKLFKTKELFFYSMFDIKMSIMLGKLMLDLFKFDDYLHQQHGNYEEEQGLSMKDVIVKYYGQEAADFTESYF